MSCIVKNRENSYALDDRSFSGRLMIPLWLFACGGLMHLAQNSVLEAGWVEIALLVSSLTAVLVHPRFFMHAVLALCLLKTLQFHSMFPLTSQ